MVRPGGPGAGRRRRAAVASRVNEARFMREFSQAAADHHLNYNFIEGFDQPWKRGQEGAMGGNWGVFDSDGQPKFPATGPVAEDPHWYRGWLGAAAGALVALWLLRVWRVRAGGLRAAWDGSPRNVSGSRWRSCRSGPMDRPDGWAAALHWGLRCRICEEIAEPAHVAGRRRHRGGLVEMF